MSKRAILTTVWWVWGMLLFLLLIGLTSIPELFGADAGRAWQWFLPNIVPAMTMVGAAAYAAPAPAEAPEGMFWMALGTSVFYLLVLTGTILTTLFAIRPLGALDGSGIWLGPLQGFATSALALHFVKR